MFEALFHHLSPAVSRSGTGLALADEFLLVLMKLAREATNQDLPVVKSLTYFTNGLMSWQLILSPLSAGLKRMQ